MPDPASCPACARAAAIGLAPALCSIHLDDHRARLERDRIRTALIAAWASAGADGRIPGGTGPTEADVDAALAAVRASS